MHLIPTDKIPWAPDLAAHIKSSNVLRGPSDGGLGGIEIVVGEVDQAPSRALLQSVHSKRQGRRNADVVVALSLGGQVWVYGPDTGRAPIVLSVQSAERQLQAALNEPNSFLAYRRLAGMQDAAAMTEMPGVRNRGLFASYHLRENVAKGRDWSSWNQKARTLIQRRHRDLISGLGFMLSSSSSESLLLTTPGQEARAVAARIRLHSMSTSTVWLRKQILGKCLFFETQNCPVMLRCANLDIPGNRHSQCRKSR